MAKAQPRCRQKKPLPATFGGALKLGDSPDLCQCGQRQDRQHDEQKGNYLHGRNSKDGHVHFQIRTAVKAEAAASWFIYTPDQPPASANRWWLLLHCLAQAGRGIEITIWILRLYDCFDKTALQIDLVIPMFCLQQKGRYGRMLNMKTIELLGQVDKNHRLSALVPSEIPPGPVKFALVVPSEEADVAGEDDAGGAWASGIAGEWGEELADQREDIYNLNDGEPVDAAR